jgi:DNA-binding IclR family transcriptional regulator
MELATKIFKILRQFKRPLSLDEISFRSRSPESSVSYFLSKLVLVNIVIEEGGNYLLNRDKSQYDFKKLFDPSDN